jgi:multiple sugar transport system substrate-binding protein
LRVWAHQGQEAEHAALRTIARSFERASESGGARVELSFFPDYHLTERLSIAAAAGDMPDAFELDGPLVARFVDARQLAPLDRIFSPMELEDFLPSVVAQGSIGGRLYAVGAYDSAAVLYYDRARFAAAGVEPPGSRGFAWPELLEACEKLVASGVRPLAAHAGETNDEWFTYAFSPLLWSAGGSLIDPTGTRVQGVLASATNVASSGAWQELFRRGFASNSPVDPDPFGNGSVAMDWSGHWMARRHLARKGAELGVMSLPRLGAEPAHACGSFCWSISAHARQPELAERWLRWVTAAETGVRPLVEANGAVPARRSAFALFPAYRSLPYALFRQQLEHGARPRPKTPFYASLTREFAAALRDIAHGADVARRLREAEYYIQREIDRRSPARQVRG